MSHSGRNQRQSWKWRAALLASALCALGIWCGYEAEQILLVAGPFLTFIAAQGVADLRGDHR